MHGNPSREFVDLLSVETLFGFKWKWGFHTEERSFLGAATAARASDLISIALRSLFS